jgi:hypothetical protein
MNGKLKGEQKKAKPKNDASPLEKALYDKPAFEEFYNEIKSSGDPNSLNVVCEYVNVSFIPQVMTPFCCSRLKADWLTFCIICRIRI